MSQPLAHTGYRYSVYGVRVISDMPFEFPAVRETEKTLADVEFVDCTEGDFPISRYAADLGAQTWFEFQPLAGGSTYLRWSDLYDFHIQADGLRVSYRRLTRGYCDVLKNFLFGQVLSCALVRQGFEPLHAAVVAIDGMAIGFLGDCTWGKSTLAASFVRAGHRLLTDDMLMVEWRAKKPIALPGSGRIKLEPDTAFALLSDATCGVRLNPDTAKRSFLLGGSLVQRTGLPLTHLFVLPSPGEGDGGAEIEIRPLSRASTLQELLKNSFNIELFDPPRLQRQFEFVAEVASKVEGFALRYPRGLYHLRDVQEAVIAHVQEAFGNRTLTAKRSWSCEPH